MKIVDVEVRLIGVLVEDGRWTGLVGSVVVVESRCVLLVK